MTALRAQPLPRRAAARVLACGAFLKNTACLVDGGTAWWSPLHDDLSTPAACEALAASLESLAGRASAPIDAVAHDRHPDFHSTRLAVQWADRLGVPAIAVQHHHAHAAVVQAELGLPDDEPLVALALDGVGLGSDGTAWGGEVLVVQGARWQRVAHLPALALPGGDVAAREPWRLAAAVLHAAGRGGEIVERLAPRVGRPLAAGVQQMLQRGLNCPPTTSAGRWFDAAAGLLGLSVRQAAEAEAAIALERSATAWLEAHAPPDGSPQGRAAPSPPPAGDMRSLAKPVLLMSSPQGRAAPSPPPAGDTRSLAETVLLERLPQPPSLDLLPLVASLAGESDAGRGAARFHLALAQALVQAAAQAAAAALATRVILGGGCFYNRLLEREVAAGLQAAGLVVLRPAQAGCGDAGLALGQAWAAALEISARAPAAPTPVTET